jgi:hypothetical protein
VEAKRLLAIPPHSRPATSSELHTIENIWNTMERHIKGQARFSSTLAEMKVAVNEEWDKV